MLYPCIVLSLLLEVEVDHLDDPAKLRAGFFAENVFFVEVSSCFMSWILQPGFVCSIVWGKRTSKRAHGEHFHV